MSVTFLTHLFEWGKAANPHHCPPPALTHHNNPRCPWRDPHADVRGGFLELSMASIRCLKGRGGLNRGSESLIYWLNKGIAAQREGAPRHLRSFNSSCKKAYVRFGSSLLCREHACTLDLTFVFPPVCVCVCVRPYNNTQHHTFVIQTDNFHACESHISTSTKSSPTPLAAAHTGTLLTMKFYNEFGDFNFSSFSTSNKIS